MVDIGCGKGRVLNFWLSNFPENKIYGIELDPEVLSATSKRLSNFSNVTLLCGNAINLIPSDGTLFYLFNPFDESVIIRFLNSLHKSIYFSENKKISIVYYNPVHINVFFEDVACNVKEIVLPARFHKAFLIELHSRVR